MAYKHIWGFGGVKLATSTHSATFSNAIGEMRFEPITQTYTTLDQRLYAINLGWRVHIECELVNACDNDYSTHQSLIDVLNDHYFGGADLMVTPRYSTTDDSLSYICKLSSGVDYQSVAPVKAAQRIRLAFDGVSPVYALPTLTSDQETGELILLGGGSNNIHLLGGTDKLLYNTGA